MCCSSVHACHDRQQRQWTACAHSTASQQLLLLLLFPGRACAVGLRKCAARHPTSRSLPAALLHASRKVPAQLSRPPCPNSVMLRATANVVTLLMSCAAAPAQDFVKHPKVLQLLHNGELMQVRTPKWVAARDPSAAAQHSMRAQARTGAVRTCTPEYACQQSFCVDALCASQARSCLLCS